MTSSSIVFDILPTNYSAINIGGDTNLINIVETTSDDVTIYNNTHMTNAF